VSEFFRPIYREDIRHGAIIRSDQAGSWAKVIVKTFSDFVRAEGLESHRVTRISIDSLLRSYEILDREASA